MVYDTKKLYNNYYIDCFPRRPLNEKEMDEIFEFLKIK